MISRILRLSLLLFGNTYASEKRPNVLVLIADDLNTWILEKSERYSGKVKTEAENLSASIAASAKGKDYPEGRVLQPQRGTPWFEMEEYKQHYETIQQLKPGWNPPGKDKKPGRKKE